ncbi:four helix bundle protein [candidate division CPR3 bacterium 4484_211]|uniref:Four helix bundle protein n=1 Tax=candidate division CPR3 bacterium 4484_211 TaxID=1968527 RepID=A0A1W9NZ84_UNCC3|nr:MAG: four helix bundle protein [candidate division CPR3 bacterium 4484_211]
MTNQIQNPNDKKVYDLEERTATFGESIVEFAQKLPNTTVIRPLVSQVVRSGTSIGANYMEADAAESKRDFKHKISLCRKEAKETMHWVRMLTKAYPVKKDKCKQLWKEAHELTLIFSTILKGKKK